MSSKRVKHQSTVGHFSRDSFDRFGDDLTELILSFLTFEDKVRLEFVSKQWKRSIFQKQFVFELREEIENESEGQNTLNDCRERGRKRS